MAESALQRVARALDLVPFITENPGVAISDLASKFNVSEKQIVKDLELIFLCGLPGYTPYELIDLSFEDGVVTVIEPQLLDKPRQFSETEAVVITLGLNLIKDSTSEGGQLAGIDKLLDKLSKRFQTVSKAIISESVKPLYYDQIIKSIKSGMLVEFKYQSLSNDSISLRKVKPVQVVFKKGFYYLIGIEDGSGDDRTFRIDQITDFQIGVTDDPGIKNSLKSKQDIEFTLETRDRFFTEKYREIFLEVIPSNDSFIVRGLVTNQHWLQRWLLSHSPSVLISSPDSLSESVREMAQSTLNLYQNPSNSAG
jgi:predicted DNA-binding transcriptional regulator YafY